MDLIDVTILSAHALVCAAGFFLKPGSTWSTWSTWGHPQTGSYLAQFEAVFFGTFFASSANRC